MPIAQALLPEFDQEMATTRKMLERVPLDRADWRPHPKSTTLGSLAAHVASLPRFGHLAIETEEIDMNPPGGPAFQLPTYGTNAEMLAAFDEHVSRTRGALSGVSDADLTTPWTLKFGGRTLLRQPRIGVLRSLMMNHIIHHRAQLGVYLRMNDVPIPASYGPSADEPTV